MRINDHLMMMVTKTMNVLVIMLTMKMIVFMTTFSRRRVPYEGEGRSLQELMTI